MSSTIPFTTTLQSGALAVGLALAGCTGAEPPRPAPAPPVPPATAPAAPVVTAESLGSIDPPLGYLVPAADTRFTADRKAIVADAVAELRVAGQPPGCGAVTWEVEGPDATPRRAEGVVARFTFRAPGRYVVRARCGGKLAVLYTNLCDFRARLEAAMAYYGESIDFTRVTMDWLGTLTDASWTAHNHVSIGDGVLDASEGCPDVTHFVHEFGHVWEHQHGQNQLALGARDQIKNLWSDQYDYGGAAGVRAAVKAGRPIESFNLEQQAEIFAHDYYMKKNGITGQYADDLAALTRPALAARPIR